MITLIATIPYPNPFKPGANLLNTRFKIKGQYFAKIGSYMHSAQRVINPSENTNVWLNGQGLILILSQMISVLKDDDC